MRFTEQDIIHETATHWVLQIKPGYFEVLKHGATHSTVAAIFDFKSDTAKHDYAKQRAIQDCNRRNQLEKES